MKITAIVYGGKRIKFNEAKINDMLNDIEKYKCADSLPKWLYIKTGFKKNNKDLKKLIKELAVMNATVDVRN